MGAPGSSVQVGTAAAHHWFGLAWNVLFTVPVVVVRYARLVWAELRRRRQLLPLAG